MKQAKALCLLLPLVLGCSPAAVQSPPGSLPYPSTSSTSHPQASSGLSTASATSPQASGGQRGQYVWDKMMEGFAMGAIAGPYGAGGGLIIGLLTGLFTAEAHFAQINARIHGEQAKDKELEAQIEQELERQRQLDAQLAKLGTQAPDSTAREPSSQGSTLPVQKTTATSQSGALASLGSKEAPPPPSSPPFRNVEVRDVNKDGVPDLWIYYNPAKPAEIVRQEEDTNGDGQVDTWSTFKGGKLARREVDTNGDAAPDVLFVYEKEMIAREERDERGDGRLSYRAFYQNRRIMKVEKDTNNDGNMDVWIYYDATAPGELVSREERDLNGDGAIDLWAYYESGRLVRRDVSATGLEVLSKAERGFSLPPEPTEKRIVREDHGAVR